MKRLVDSSRVTYGSKITDHIWSDNNGQLICRDVIIARTGKYQYLESEIEEDGDPNKVVDVYRTDDEVFSPIAIASFENKPFCNDHPDDDVDCDNYKELSCGFIRDIRRGQGDLSNCLICDIVVTDPEVIELIKSGEKRELSLGYNCNIEKDNNGRYIQTHIRGNHLALVDSGRAGIATIRDSCNKINKNLGGYQTVLRRKNTLPKIKRMIYDDDEVGEIEVEEVKDDEDEVKNETVGDDDVAPVWATELSTKLDKVLSMLGGNQTIGDDDEVVEDDDEEVVEDDDEVESEITKDDDEVVEDDDDEVVEDDDEDVVEDDDDELLDADDIVETPVKTSDRKSSRYKDSSRTYSKFVKTKDTSSTNNKRKEIENSFKNRYKNAIKGGR
jgi:hypothetical protein